MTNQTTKQTDEPIRYNIYDNGYGNTRFMVSWQVKDGSNSPLFFETREDAEKFINKQEKKS